MFQSAETPTETVEIALVSEGIEGSPRPLGYGENSWLSSIIVATLVLLALNISHLKRMFKNFPQDLLGLRRRSNAFDEDSSGRSLRTILLVTALLCLSEGILLFAAAWRSGLVVESSGIFATTMLLAGVTLAFYLAQILYYNVVGYAFTDRFGRSQWLRGFAASQSLLAFLLIIPALVSLFYPDTASAMLTIAVISYIFTRILFICKGFKIFYTDFASIFYFFLYLCTLEITPLLMIRSCVIDLLRNY